MLASLLLATTLTVARDQPLARFDPERAVGAAIDAHGEGETRRILTKANVRAMLSAGFKPLSYRLETELCGEAWHWNPRGSWSDAAHAQGYWTSDAHGARIAASYGYKLPRRGNTIDQAHNSDYSRIDDGDVSTFWKSNPYLDSPQWLIADLGEAHRVDAIAITWARPFATAYEIQYWDGVGDALKYPIGGDWRTFDRGAIDNARGGTTRHDLGAATARWIRIRMTRSEGGRKTSDWRDAAGFAVAEIAIFDGRRDLIRHAPSHARQTVIWVSSTDPWHRARDIDRTLEQPGFDAVIDSGLTRSLPMLAPVPLLYGTPEDAAAEIRYLRERGVAIGGVEMGEEPDGQNVSPEDYAALYVRFASALHDVDPHLSLGGPAFQSTRDFVAYWRDAHGRTSWIGRFVDFLRARERLRDFNFFSFEWYPVDDICGDVQTNLVDAPKVFAKVVKRWRDEGLPEDVPLLVTEYGWSSYAAEAEVDVAGALFDADFLADFLAQGGAAAYFYGLEPEVPIRELRTCAQYGNLMLFLGDAQRRIRAKVAAFYATQLFNERWLAPRGTHEIFAVNGTSDRLRAWAVRRPDGTWSMLVINKGDDASVSIPGATDGWQIAQRDYRWIPGPNGRPAASRLPRPIRAGTTIELPRWSMTVVTWGAPASPPAGSRASRSRRRRDAAVPAAGTAALRPPAN